MTSIIFDRKGALRISKQATLEDNNVTVYYCQQGFLVNKSKTKFKTNLQAKKYFENIAQIFRDAGFDEYNVTNKTHIGTISYIEGTNGTGRIRVDAIGDIYFNSDTNGNQKFKQGQRVLVSGIKKKEKSTLSFMFESPWVSTLVEPLQKGIKNKRRELPETTRNKILKETSVFLKGFQTQQKISKPFKIGQLVYGYYSGIFRVVRIKGKMAICEEVYNSKLLRAPGATNEWLTTFCRPVAPSIVKML